MSVLCKLVGFLSGKDCFTFAAETLLYVIGLFDVVAALDLCMGF
ncbi:hypothetical protein [Prochlorococcus marinus]|nr:hypothetical protein [Prochlorococcus marinus]